MSPKPKLKHRELPPRMTVRTWQTKRGRQTAYYYEHPRDESGKRRAEALGTNLAAAKRRWAEIEGHPIRIDSGTLEDVYTRYMKWANQRQVSNLEPRTIHDREQYWKNLKIYAACPVNELRSKFALDYFEARSSKVSAKKELKFLSLMCNWARARGLMKASNPFTGVLRELKVDEARDIYVTDAQLALVYKHAPQVVRDVLDLAELCTLRPCECWGITWADERDNALHIQLPKTAKRGLRTKRVTVDGELSEFLERIKARPVVGRTILADRKGQPLTPFGTFRYHFDKARKAAAAEAKRRGLKWQDFQFRDIRAKAVTDRTEVEGLESARMAAGHTTQNQTRAYNRARQGEKTTPTRRRR